MASVKLYFWIGIISAILLRTILIADHYNSQISDLMWYMGVIGYLIFFAHRYDIAKHRYGVIKNLGLLEKIEMRQSLTEEDFDGLDYIMWSLSVSKERLNYLAIFVLSIVAILLSLMLDLRIVIVEV